MLLGTSLPRPNTYSTHYNIAKNSEVCIPIATAHFSDGECAQLKEECNLGATPKGEVLKGGDFRGKQFVMQNMCFFQTDIITTVVVKL